MNKRPIIWAGPAYKKIPLTEKEMAYMRYCSQDIKIADIAVKMRKSIGGVNHLRESLLFKLNVRSSTGIVVWAFQHGLINKSDIKLIPPKRKRRLAAFSHKKKFRNSSSVRFPRRSC